MNKIKTLLLNESLTAPRGKTFIQQIRNSRKTRCVLAGLLAILGMVVPGHIEAQSFATLYSFGGGTDGANPYAGLLPSSNTLYGTAYSGGNAGLGAIFSLKTDGTAFTTLYSFSGASDGAKPHGALVLSGNVLYGTASSGGPNNNGTVFAVNTDGIGLQTLHAFAAYGQFVTNDDGATPVGALILWNNTLFGTALYGGGTGNGTVFKLNTDGTGFTTLYSFSGGTDGGLPQGTLVLSGGTLYGAASVGGSSGNGTMFKVNIDGTGFAALYSFPASDGTLPNGLILSGQTLYGTAGGGGSFGYGTVFALNTDGTGSRTLHSFSGSDGRTPVSPLLLSGSILYGAAQYNTGGSGDGTIFAINADGTGFTNVYSFTATSGVAGQNSDGSEPNSGLVGCNFGYGSIFSLSLPASPSQLNISSAGGSVILTWPASAAGFTLQSTTNLGSSALWASVPTATAIVNGQNTVTNPISNVQEFYRLSQ